MNNKRLIINIFSNITSFTVSMGISFLLTPYIITSVGKETYYVKKIWYMYKTRTYRNIEENIILT